MRVSCIIPARGGSKGIPNKNLIEFCGKPLLAWTILQAKACNRITDVWVSSDSDEILSVAEKYGAKRIKRPDELSGDKSSSESAWLHALSVINSQNDASIDYIVAPQVTSPLRESADLTNALNRLVESDGDSLLSVAEVEDYFCWKLSNGVAESVNYDYRDRKPRQLIEKRYLENGSFYIVKPNILLECKNRLGGKILLHEMERYKMFQIDTQEDLRLCEVVMKGYGLDRL